MSIVPITAIVTAYRRVEQTLETLRNLQACKPRPAEILVHVDGNQTATATAIRQAFPEVRFLLSAENLGPGGGRNKLIAAASHPLVASFDDDSYPLDPDYFARLAGTFARHPAAVIVTARVFERGTRLEAPVDVDAWVADFSGGACTYHREAFLRTGGYVPLPLAYGMEEVDLALRLHAQGGRVLRSQALRVFHDTDLAHHLTPQMTTAGVGNAALLMYLRYPLSQWATGFLQWMSVLLYYLRAGRWRGLVAGVVLTPVHLYRHRMYRNPLSHQQVKSYLHLRRNPVPVEKTC